MTVASQGKDAADAASPQDVRLVSAPKSPPCSTRRSVVAGFVVVALAVVAGVLISLLVAQPSADTMPSNVIVIDADDSGYISADEVVAVGQALQCSFELHGHEGYDESIRASVERRAGSAGVYSREEADAHIAYVATYLPAALLVLSDCLEARNVQVQAWASYESSLSGRRLASSDDAALTVSTVAYVVPQTINYSKPSATALPGDSTNYGLMRAMYGVMNGPLMTTAGKSLIEPPVELQKAGSSSFARAAPSWVRFNGYNYHAAATSCSLTLSFAAWPLSMDELGAADISALTDDSRNFNFSGIDRIVSAALDTGAKLDFRLGDAEVGQWIMNGDQVPLGNATVFDKPFYGTEYGGVLATFPKEWAFPVNVSDWKGRQLFAMVAAKIAARVCSLVSSAQGAVETPATVAFDLLTETGDGDFFPGDGEQYAWLFSQVMTLVKAEAACEPHSVLAAGPNAVPFDAGPQFLSDFVSKCTDFGYASCPLDILSIHQFNTEISEINSWTSTAWGYAKGMGKDFDHVGLAVTAWASHGSGSWPTYRTSFSTSVLAQAMIALQSLPFLWTIQIFSTSTFCTGYDSAGDPPNCFMGWATKNGNTSESGGGNLEMMGNGLPLELFAEITPLPYRRNITVNSLASSFTTAAIAAADSDVKNNTRTLAVLLVNTVASGDPNIDVNYQSSAPLPLEVKGGYGMICPDGPPSYVVKTVHSNNTNASAVVVVSEPQEGYDAPSIELAYPSVVVVKWTCPSSGS